MMATVLGRSLRQLFVVRAVYMQVRYDEIPNEMKNMLIKVGSKLDSIGKDIPVLSVPGWMVGVRQHALICFRGNDEVPRGDSV